MTPFVYPFEFEFDAIFPLELEMVLEADFTGMSAVIGAISADAVRVFTVVGEGVMVKLYLNEKEHKNLSLSMRSLFITPKFQTL